MSLSELERRAEEPAESNLERLKYESKREHGGNATHDFILISIVLFLITRTKLLSLSVVAYFLGGMFVAAILSIPTWLLKLALARRISARQARALRFFWTITEWAYNLGVTWCLFHLYKGFVS